MRKHLYVSLLFLLLCLSILSMAGVQTTADVPFANVPFDVNNIPEPVPPPPAVVDSFQLDPYYQQWINVRGFPVLASAEVRPYTVKEAAWTIGHMVGHRPDILEAMARNKARFSIVPHNKHLPEIPEYDWGRLNFFWETRARGVGGQTTTSPEENIICGDRNYCYAELIHEFAHQLHDWGLKRIDSTFDSRLDTMYNAALKEGLYQERYAGSNRWEYWAEGVGSWFNGPHPNNVAHTRLALKKYDPRLAGLLTEVFGDGSWRYTPPATRTHLPHLQGFNPQEAPIYQRPPRLLELEEQLWDPDSDGGGKWVNLKLYDPSGLSHLKKLTTSGNRTEFLFGKLIGTDLALYFFNADGKKILHQYITSADFLAVDTEVGAIWLIQDHTGKDLAVFRAEKEVGRVLVTPTLHLITPGLSKVSGDNQTGVSGAVLADPFVVEVRDQNVSLVEGISVTFTVSAGDGTLSATRTMTDENGRAESTLTLGSNPMNTVSVSAAGIEQPVTFNAMAETPVNIPDPTLRDAIEKSLNKTPGTSIIPSEMATFTDFFLDSGLIQAVRQAVQRASFSGASADGATISSLRGLESATNLTSLSLWDNSISDISPLAGLTNLTTLWLQSNNITEISAIAGLTNLTSLLLGDNSISDLSPLVANTGLGTGDQVSVENNPLSYQSIHTHIPTLQKRGVEVAFNNRIALTLLRISGVITASDNVLIVEVRDIANQPFEGVPVTFTVISGGGVLSITQTVTDKNGRAESTLTLGLHQGTNTVSVSAEGRTVTFNAVAETPVNIPDKTLRAVIETTLNIAAGVQILSSDMETLTRLTAGNANISDLTGLEAATHLTELNLWDNNISDISAVVGLTNLTGLGLGGNSVTDISPVAELANLTLLHLPSNPVADISLVAGLVNLTYLNLNRTNISDISPVAGLTHLTDLYLGENNITDISHLTGLTDLRLLWLQDTNISDLSALVANTGLGEGDEVNVDRNPLSYTSINTHIPTLRSRGVVVSANNLKPPTLEYTLSISAGLNLIHVPLKVSAVDGMAKTLTSISDLYDTLGGADAVNFLITYDTSAQGWLTYFGNTERGTANDKALTDAMGILAGMKTPTSVRLTGKPLGNNGSSTIDLKQGLNLVGLPLKDTRINRVSDLLSLEGIRGNVPVVIVTVDGDFKSVGRAGDPADITITGGQGFMLNTQPATTVTLSGEGWTNSSATAAPLMARTGLPVRHTTPVLALKGEIVDEVSAVNRVGFRVTVKNLSTGRQVATTAAAAETGYRLAVVDIGTQRAAQVGDTLEISAQSTNPFIGVKPLRYAVTAEDVLQGWIQLPELVAYEIPKETELLANYPNPFNPETWIPYRLAEDGFVTLTIYDREGHAVRAIDVGHRVAAVYESRSKAIYWDGRNAVGEQVASGVYFYQLQAGSESFLRKMVILK